MKEDLQVEDRQVSDLPAPQRSVRPYRSLPIDQFKVVGGGEDPFHERLRSKGRFTGWLASHLPNAHRRYVGGDAKSGVAFREACRFQLDFMINQGLQPHSVLLDLGCGCLRGGIHFIDYLDANRYLGMDLSAEAIWRGIDRELGHEEFRVKRPQFVVSDQFDFDQFSQRPQFVFANSVFTHLPPDDIQSCLKKLREFIDDGGAACFCTFREVEADGDSASVNHYLGGRSPMTYSQAEMHELGRCAGWQTGYIGSWGHPKNEMSGPFRRQMMFRFSCDPGVPAPAS